MVDNRTSDGLIRTPQTVNPNDLAKCGRVLLQSLAAPAGRVTDPVEADRLLEQAFFLAP